MKKVNESSVNRVKAHSEKFDIAIITAYRNKYIHETEHTLDDRTDEYKDTHKTEEEQKADPFVYDLSMNKKRNKALKAYLLDLGYGVTSVDGNYIEGHGTPEALLSSEKSFVVVNLNGDSDFYSRIFQVSEYYNQDCFLYMAREWSEAVLVGTNRCDYPGYGNKEKLGKFRYNVDHYAYTGVGNRTFSFTNDKLPQRESKYSPTGKPILETVVLETKHDCGVGAKTVISKYAKPIREHYEQNKERISLMEGISSIKSLTEKLDKYGSSK